jgi:hypothetical protein
MATLNAIPPTLDLNVYAGDDVTITLTIEEPGGFPYDLTGTLLAQIRKAHGQEVVGLFTINVPDPPTGVCYLTLTDDMTRALGVDGGRHSWDLELTDGSDIITTIVKGALSTSLDITQEAIP